MPLTNQGSYDLFSHLGSYRNIMQFQISYRRENSKKILYQMQKTTALGRWTEEETDLPFLRTVLTTHQKSWEPSFWKVMDSFVLLAYASLAASRTLLQRLLACLNFTLDSEDLFCWYKWKKWFLWTMTAAQAAENHGDEWGLTWYFLWGIYTWIPTWTQNSLKASKVASLNISCHGPSLK